MQSVLIQVEWGAVVAAYIITYQNWLGCALSSFSYIKYGTSNDFEKKILSIKRKSHIYEENAFLWTV